MGLGLFKCADQVQLLGIHLVGEPEQVQVNVPAVVLAVAVSTMVAALGVPNDAAVPVAVTPVDATAAVATLP